MAKDKRPPVAVGHISLDVTDLARSTTYFKAVGMRSVHEGDSVTVLELRGGTHLILRPGAEPVANGAKAPFDLMVDDVDGARDAYAAKGLAPSATERGTIHDRFTITDPDGTEITVTSSHASGQPI